MQLISVNVGRAREIDGRRARKTGIFKIPVSEPVEITELGLAGDAICDRRHHGGADQAVYVYGSQDYDWWTAELGRTLSPGTFGENLTIGGLASAEFGIGDRLSFREVVLEVTAPRIPCGTLAARMEDSSFVKRFRAAERPGLYCRVIRPGVLRAGEAVATKAYEGERVTIVEMFRDAYERELTEAALRRYLAAPIAVRDRASKEAQLRKLGGEAS